MFPMPTLANLSLVELELVHNISIYNFISPFLVNRFSFKGQSLGIQAGSDYAKLPRKRPISREIKANF